MYKASLALNSVSDFDSLKLRLKHAKMTLHDKYQKLFSIQDKCIDFKNKRLISKCGKYSLQWQLRDNPDLPESYENQQTTIGIVRCYKLSEVKNE